MPWLLNRHCPCALILFALTTFMPFAAACERPYKVGISPLGWGYYQDGGKTRGLIVDLIQALEARSGCQLPLELRPRPRVIQEFLSGQVDIITSSLQFPDRDAVGLFIPYGLTKLDLVVRDDVPRSMDSMAKLLASEGLTLGLVRGIGFGPLLAPTMEQLTAQGRVELAPDIENLAARFSAGRFQVAVYPAVIHSKLIRDGLLPNNVRIVDVPESPPQVTGLYVNRSTVAEADRQQLDRSLRQLVREGVFETIYRKYLGEEETRRLFRVAR